MKKLLGVLAILLLVVGGCGNSPQQKARQMEKEIGRASCRERV